MKLCVFVKTFVSYEAVCLCQNVCVLGSCVPLI